VMYANLNDEAQSWIMDSDARYHRIEPVGEGFNCHVFFMTNPSLSGRGKAIKKAGRMALSTKLAKNSGPKKATRKTPAAKSSKSG